MPLLQHLELGCNSPKYGGALPWSPGDLFRTTPSLKTLKLSGIFFESRSAYELAEDGGEVWNLIDRTLEEWYKLTHGVEAFREPTPPPRNLQHLSVILQPSSKPDKDTYNPPHYLTLDYIAESLRDNPDLLSLNIKSGILVGELGSKIVPPMSNLQKIDIDVNYRNVQVLTELLSILPTTPMHDICFTRVPDAVAQFLLGTTPHLDGLALRILNSDCVEMFSIVDDEGGRWVVTAFGKQGHVRSFITRYDGFDDDEDEAEDEDEDVQPRPMPHIIADTLGHITRLHIPEFHWDSILNTLRDFDFPALITLTASFDMPSCIGFGSFDEAEKEDTSAGRWDPRSKQHKQELKSASGTCGMRSTLNAPVLREIVLVVDWLPDWWEPGVPVNAKALAGFVDIGLQMAHSTFEKLWLVNISPKNRFTQIRGVAIQSTRMMSGAEDGYAM